jgi:hypothetical protein
MKKEDLEKGKLLMAAAHKWWGSSLPPFEHANHQDEPIPQLVRWLKEKAFPELERKGKRNAKK